MSDGGFDAQLSAATVAPGAVSSSCRRGHQVGENGEVLDRGAVWGGRVQFYRFPHMLGTHDQASLRIINVISLSLSTIARCLLPNAGG